MYYGDELIFEYNIFFKKIVFFYIACLIIHMLYNKNV